MRVTLGRMNASMSILKVSAVVTLVTAIVAAGGESADALNAIAPVDPISEVTEALESHGLIDLDVDAEVGPYSEVDIDGISVETPEGVTSLRPLDGNAGVAVSDDVVVFPADDSYSTAVTAQGRGAVSNAAYVVINGRGAPSEFAFGVEVDDSPALLHLVDDIVLVENAAGEVVNFIAAPWALDDNGRHLPTWYEVDGDVIVQHIDLDGAAFPVVADPKMACDALNCTLEYNKAETRDVASTSSLASYLVGAACTAFGTAIAGFVCAAITAWFVDTANSAQNQKKCVGIRAMRIPGPQSAPYPVVYSGGNCK